MTLAVVLQFVAGGLSLLSAKLMGDVSLKGPIIGIISQLCWAVAVVLTPIWGMAPWVALFLAVHIRNLVKWYRAGLRWRSALSPMEVMMAKKQKSTRDMGKVKVGGTVTRFPKK